MGKDMCYIGIVKFFDIRKGFGYIASNNCNMNTTIYNQDFYVNSDSFAELGARIEGRVVVFQKEVQENGRRKAKNVRLITKSDEDINLLLSYYGDHELVEFRENQNINLYRQTSIPRKFVAEKVQSIILNDPERSPKKTAQHFSFFVERYKKDADSIDQYVFDRDFTKCEKSIWISLFSVLTNEELIEILKMYPSVCRYIDNIVLLKEWIDNDINENCTLSKMQQIINNISYLPREYEIDVKERIETITDIRVKDLFFKLSHCSVIIGLDFIFDPIILTPWQLDGMDRETKKIIRELSSYLRLTSKSYKEEKQQCLAALRMKQFQNELNHFSSRPFDSCRQDSFFRLLNNIPNEEFASFREDVKVAISRILDGCISEKLLEKAVPLLKNSSILGNDFILYYKKKMQPIILEYLSDMLNSYVKCQNANICDFFPIFDNITSIYDDDEKDIIVQALVPIIRQTNSLSILSEASTSDYQLISVDEALIYAKEIISTWSYRFLNEFTNTNERLFDDDPRYAEILIERAMQLIWNIPLKSNFDSSQVDSIDNNSDDSWEFEHENCSFLYNLQSLIPNGHRVIQWENYINSKGIDDLIIMFNNNVIKSLPEHAIEEIINSISLDCISLNVERWYNKPKLCNNSYIRILKSSPFSLCPFITKRLLQLNMSNENIPLAILLAELMMCNKPDGSDPILLRNWEEEFRKNLTRIHNSRNLNPYISTILWAVHFQTDIPTTLPDVFAFLPPYIQIRCVRKLFQLISQGKIHHSAETLYDTITNCNKPICLPLEIVFTYLKNREINPSTSLNNNIMCLLLNNREDHEEWSEIRQLVTICCGRWIAKKQYYDDSNRRRNRYYNGIIYKSGNRLKLFVPYKMVDGYAHLTNYNNKYSKQIVDLIKLTYSTFEYEISNEPQGVSFLFDESYESELFGFARPFNFKYNGLDNMIEFEMKGDEKDDICECRLSNKVDAQTGIGFYWCKNKPCFREPIRYMLDSEWERYTILDFMRILNIPVDYYKEGVKIKFGHYIILSSYLGSFKVFYEHLKCRNCGKLLKPKIIGNFGYRSITEFSCKNNLCSEEGSVVYLNHCFNRQNCNTIIDSRDSKTCPNGQYICPNCGACCSTENYRMRINNLHKNGGSISNWIINFVQKDLGHWEKKEFYCHKCGKQMAEKNGYYQCDNCDVKYNCK